jgi:hypothetical protein
MPRTGRRPQSTNVKQLRGVRFSRVNAAEPQSKAVEPEPPEWTEGSGDLVLDVSAPSAEGHIPRRAEAAPDVAASVRYGRTSRSLNRV